MIVVKVSSPTTTFDLGAYLSGTSLDTTQVTNQEIQVVCYPSGGGITITLPPTDFNAVQNLKVTVADAAGTAASHNVTVTAGTGVASLAQEKINGANTMVISADYGSVNCAILTTGAWIGGGNP